MKFCHYILLVFGFFACSQNPTKMPNTNALVHESSPYLLQHAHNPVNWYPWGEEALSLAKKQNKLLIISIGYAACHWCHVMENESFEDTLVAEVMNENFVSIKVDREERPDVDQVYMNAVQLMTGGGGWPLNVVALPDGRPVWGGTFFRKDDWVSILNQISEQYAKAPQKFEEYADNLTQGIRAMDQIALQAGHKSFEVVQLDALVSNWKKQFDNELGGRKNPPKFMMPNSLNFLLRFGVQNFDSEVTEFVKLTLRKMAFGGLYDRVGGGFARYSTDAHWHIPHFEKMLYDNAQLVSLYANAYKWNPDSLYKQVVTETLSFIEREMTDASGGFYSSFDADSEGEEGTFYVWRKDELKNLLKGDFEAFSLVFNVNDYGYWEDDKYVLIRTLTDEEAAEKLDISVSSLREKIVFWQKLLFEARQKRTPPPLDDKVLTGWSALMITAYAHAYQTFGEENYRQAALKAAQFIKQKQTRADGGLWRNYKSGKSSINAFLEDYALTIEAFIKMYEITADESWINSADAYAQYVHKHFSQEKLPFFYFTSDEDVALVSRSVETSDNVIPSSNSVMAKNLFLLGIYLEKTSYSDTAEAMLQNILPAVGDNGGPWFANWLDLMMNYTHPFYEVAISGVDATDKLSQWQGHYLPNVMLATASKPSEFPLLKNRYLEGETSIFVCQNYVCKLPVVQVEDALKLISFK